MDRYVNITIPPGGKIPTLEVYASLLNPYAVEDDNFWINDLGCVASKHPDPLCVVQTDDKHFSLLPGPEFSPRLYRGQPLFYRRCLPLLFRQPFTQIGYLTSLLKKYEFYKLMAGHPIVNHLRGWSVDGKSFKIDIEGLSAHYEFATSMIDVSRSKDVAMFFALCERNAKTNRYEPIADENREAVLYTVNLKAFLEKSRDHLFHVVGFQALPRPDVQKAYLILLGSDQDFNDCPFVTYEVFPVSRKQAARYFDMFDGGSKLFPDDPVDAMALQIRQSIEIDREVLEASFERHWIPRVWANASEVSKFLGKFGYSVTDKQMEFSDNVRKSIVEKWNRNPQLYGDRVGCRFTFEPL
jgi:hypothetical protein